MQTFIKRIPLRENFEKRTLADTHQFAVGLTDWDFLSGLQSEDYLELSNDSQDSDFPGRAL